MDSSFVIKPPPAIAKSRAMRDPVAVRGAVDADAVETKIVTYDEPGSRGGGKHDAPKDHEQRPKDGEQRTAGDHLPHDLVANPDSRDVILRERDVRAAEREHPDHALLRVRAYRPAHHDDVAATPSDDPHADIRA